MMAYRFRSLASSATPCKRRGRSCSQGEVFRKRARASTESHAAIPPVPVARRSTQGCFQGEGLPERRGKAHSPPRKPSPSPCGAFPGAPGACSGYARRRPLGRSRPRRTKTRKGSQGKPRCNPSNAPHETAKEGQSPSKRKRARKEIPLAGLHGACGARGRGIPQTQTGPQGDDPPAGLISAKRKAPSASATPCPPAAWRCSTLGEGGLNCRVRDGTG